MRTANKKLCQNIFRVGYVNIRALNGRRNRHYLHRHHPIFVHVKDTKTNVVYMLYSEANF